MATDREILDWIGNSFAIHYGSVSAHGTFQVFNLKSLLSYLRTQQASIASGVRTITGMCPMLTLNLSSIKQVDTVIMLGANGPSSGGSGVDVYIDESQFPQSTLRIAIGGHASRQVGTKTNGGFAFCKGVSHSLMIAVGGNGQIPRNPPTMEYGTDGTDGGDGGFASASGSGTDNHIYAIGGNGQKGSPGQVGQPGTPPGTPGKNGDDGDGGDAYAIGGTKCDFYAQGGKRPRPGTTLPTLPGVAGTTGFGVVQAGPDPINILMVRDGDGSRGLVDRTP